MDKNGLLRNIAETGYNVGFGGRKHFATYDIVDKTPRLISFCSMAFGIYALALDGLSSRFTSATFIVLGIIGLYISFYNEKKSDYEKVAIRLTEIYNALRDLYRHVQSMDDADLSNEDETLKVLEREYYKICISKQILFSDWYAHYKFFWQYQIDWINEQKNFSFWRDKIPLTGYMACAVIVFVVLCVIIKYAIILYMKCPH